MTSAQPARRRPRNRRPATRTKPVTEKAQDVADRMDDPARFEDRPPSLVELFADLDIDPTADTPLYDALASKMEFAGVPHDYSSPGNGCEI